MTRGDLLAGIVLSAAGIGVLSAMDATAKSLGAVLSPFQIGFVRYLGAALWLVPVIVLTRGAWPRRRNMGRHAARAALLALTAGLFFYAVVHLPLAIATALWMSAPVYVSLLGVVLLKERFTGGLALAVLLGLAGSLVIVMGGAPIETGSNAKGLAWGAAILAPVSYASALLLLKHHAEDESAASMTLAQSLIAALLFLPLALPGLSVPSGGPWLQIALVGLLGAVGIMLLTTGLRRVPASVFSILDYTGLLWAAAFGALLFAEIPGPQFWAGGGMIVAACAISARAGRRAAPVST